MMVPRLLTRPIEERLVRDARARVDTEVARLAALQAELQELETAYEAAIERATGDSNGDPPADAPSALELVDAAAPADQASLHAVSFEDLRDLGLSVNEASRVLASRHRGDLVRLSDLGRVPGLSRAVRTTLEARLTD